MEKKIMKIKSCVIYYTAFYVYVVYGGIHKVLVFLYFEDKVRACLYYYKLSRC